MLTSITTPPPPDFSPAASLAFAAAQHPHRASLIAPCDGSRLDAESAFITVRRIVSVLESLSIGEGDAVAVIASNSPWHFLLHAACAWIHAINVPISPRLPASQLAALVIDCEAHLVLTDLDSACSPAGGAPWVPLDDFTVMVEGAEPVAQPPLPCQDEVAAIIYTSGSSGTPKGVELTHANLWWGSRSFRDGFEYSPSTDVVGVCAPLSHIGGFNGTALDMFANGGTVVILPQFEASLVLRTVETYSISIMFVVPTMFRLLLDAYEHRPADLSSWRLPLVGGDALDKILASRLHTIGVRPIHVWGMTETAGAGTMLSQEASVDDPSAIGRPFPYIEARVCSATGEIITAPNTVGELHVRGPHVTARYHSYPLLSSCPDTSNGWFATGDLARYDEDGFLFFVSRSGRMINTGGETVSPLPIEAALRTLPGIRDALVVGLPDPRWGQIIGALVERDEDCAGEGTWGICSQARTAVALPDPLRKVLCEQLAPWQLPRRILMTAVLPMNGSGKPDTVRARCLLLGGEGDASRRAAAGI